MHQSVPGAPFSQPLIFITKNCLVQFCQFVLNFISRPTYHILFDFLFSGRTLKLTQKKKKVVQWIKDKYIRSGLKYILCRFHRKKELKKECMDWTSIISWKPPAKDKLIYIRISGWRKFWRIKLINSCYVYFA